MTDLLTPILHRFMNPNLRTRRSSPRWRKKNTEISPKNISPRHQRTHGRSRSKYRLRGKELSIVHNISYGNLRIGLLSRAFWGRGFIHSFHWRQRPRPDQKRVFTCQARDDNVDDLASFPLPRIRRNGVNINKGTPRLLLSRSPFLLLSRFLGALGRRSSPRQHAVALPLGTVSLFPSSFELGTLVGGGCGGWRWWKD